MQTKCKYAENCRESAINFTIIRHRIKEALNNAWKCVTYVFFCLIEILLRRLLKFDRYVLKRYLNIETPLYKAWWKHYAKSIQTQLNNQKKEI
jgi:hypothetical protein